MEMVKWWALVSLAACGLFLFFDHGMGFDIAFSPAWQVVLFYLALVPFGLMLFFMVVYLLFPRTRGWEWLALGLGVLVLAGVLALGWHQEGSYSGFRDHRVDDLAAVVGVISAFSAVLLSAVRLAWVRMQHYAVEGGLA